MQLKYNSALAFLRLKAPLKAFDCLVACLPAFEEKARFWVRMAEACILHYENRKTLWVGKTDKKTWLSEGVVDAEVGAGAHHRYYLVANATLPAEADAGGQPRCTLRYASYSLHRALALVRKAFDEGVSGGDIQQVLKNLAPKEDQYSWRERNEHLRTVCLCKLAYVHLCLNDPLVALEAAQEVLTRCTARGLGVNGKASGSEGPIKLGNDSEWQWYMMAHLYSAEALSMLDRVDEASRLCIPSLASAASMRSHRVASQMANADGGGGKSEEEEEEDGSFAMETEVRSFSTLASFVPCTR